MSNSPDAVMPYGGGPAAKNLPILLLSRARCVEFIAKKKTMKNGTSWNEDLITGCWLSLTNLRPDGYVGVKLFSNDQLAEIAAAGSQDAAGLRHKEKNFMLHVISLSAHTGLDVTGVASHLCGSKACFNPLHLRDESQKANIDRNYCPGSIVCSHGAVLSERCEHAAKWGAACVKVVQVQCCFEMEGVTPPPDHLRGSTSRSLTTKRAPRLLSTPSVFSDLSTERAPRFSVALTAALTAKREPHLPPVSSLSRKRKPLDEIPPSHTKQTKTRAFVDPVLFSGEDGQEDGDGENEYKQI